MIDNPTITTKNKSKYILGAVLFVMLMAGLTATYWLTQQSQDIRQQASGPTYDPDEGCSGGSSCVDSIDCVRTGGTQGASCGDGRTCCGPAAPKACPAGTSDYGSGTKCATTCTGNCVGENGNCCDLKTPNACSTGESCVDSIDCVRAGGTQGASCGSGKLCCGPTAPEACPAGSSDYGSGTKCATACSGDCVGRDGNCCTDNSTKACGDGPACNSGFVCIKDRYEGYVCKDADLFECDMERDNCPGDSTCHCLGGDRCDLGTVCDPDIETQCKNQGRAYCDNMHGFAKTCCVPGYVCCADTSIGGAGCCEGPKPSSPPPSPKPTPSPSPSPSPGPQCLDITMDNPDAEWGDQTTFTCGAVAGVDHYVFRVMSPDGIVNPLGATGRISAPYLIAQFGTYFAQCQICTSADDSSCHAWEPLPDQIYN
jgi:hypothetical protein